MSHIDELVAAFERPSDGPRRHAITVEGLQIEMMEVAGTYRFPMGPPIGKKKRHAAHVLKKGWRALAATVDARDRGHWFFRMLGPNDTVQAAKSSFENMMRSVK